MGQLKSVPVGLELEVAVSHSANGDLNALRVVSLQLS